MGNAGSGHPPYVVFKQALEAGDLGRVRALLAEMPRTRATWPTAQLGDLLRVCLLMCDEDEDLYEQAATRWLMRLLWEVRTIQMEDVQRAAAALEALPDRPDSAMEQLQAVCLRYGVA